MTPSHRPSHSIRTRRSLPDRDGRLSGGRLAATALALALFAAAAGAEADWPQFRGPDGLGVAEAAGPLPVAWGPESDNLRWRTTIPGEGISSPIAAGGRAFLTTAYEGRNDALQRGLLRGAAAALAALFLVLAWRERRRAAAIEDPATRRDRKVVFWLSLVVALAGIAMAAKPDLFYTLGNPSRAWRIGLFWLLGLAAAAGWFGRDSRWRLTGLAVVAATAAYLWIGMPSGPLGPAPLEKRAVIVLPGLALALYYLVGRWRARRGGAAAPAGHDRPLLALLLTLVASFLFCQANYLNKLQRVVLAVDLASGEILWETPVLAGAPEQKWDHSTYATPTPATDGERVYAYFGHGLAAVDLDGELLWRVTYPGYRHATRYGAGSSPVVAGHRVFVMAEAESFQQGPPSWIAAYDRATGAELWRTEPPETKDSYSTPMVVGSGDDALLLTASWEKLVAYDVSTGERLWSHPYPMQQVVASLARSGDLVAATGGTFGEKHLVVVRATAAGAVPVWQTKRAVPSISTPVFYDGKLFTVTTPGILTVYDAASGDKIDQARLPADVFASLVAGDGKVYSVNTDGTTAVVAAGPEIEVLAENELGEPVYATPAIAGGCLLVRTATSLVCIEAEARDALEARLPGAVAGAEGETSATGPAPAG